METQYFIQGEGGTFRPCSEEDIDSLEGEGFLAVEVTGDSNTAWNIETTQWWAPLGICRLTVNLFPLETALEIFGKMVKDFTEAEKASHI